MYYLTKELFFPPVETASPEGIVAVGGDLSPERLVLAYNSGIFPWFEDDEPILWWSPPERMVLFFEDLKISKSMRNIINQRKFKVTFNTSFRDVILNCKKISRKDQPGTWITDNMVETYCKLNELGIAKSVEVWQDDELVGGLYGVHVTTVSRAVDDKWIETPRGDGRMRQHAGEHLGMRAGQGEREIGAVGKTADDAMLRRCGEMLFGPGDHHIDPPARVRFVLARAFAHIFGLTAIGVAEHAHDLDRRHAPGFDLGADVRGGDVKPAPAIGHVKRRQRPCWCRRRAPDGDRARGVWVWPWQVSVHARFGGDGFVAGRRFLRVRGAGQGKGNRKRAPHAGAGLVQAAAAR